MSGSGSSGHLEDHEVATLASPTGASTPLLEAGAAPAESYDAITPAGDVETGDGAAASAGAEGAEAGAPKKKKEKSGQKIVSDLLKTDMAAERTFFKWLWTGLHTGAIGTFIFVTFDDGEGGFSRVAVVSFAWLIAFGLVLFGLYAYNRRRAALREGRIDMLPALTREYGPYVVVLALVLVVGSGLVFAMFSGAELRKGRHGIV